MRLRLLPADRERAAHRSETPCFPRSLEFGFQPWKANSARSGQRFSPSSCGLDCSKWQLIQTRPKIPETIAKDAAETKRWLNLDDGWFGCNYIALVFNGELTRVRVQVSADFFLERLQVFLCPDDFEPSAV
jgi:hypothetical protein